MIFFKKKPKYYDNIVRQNSVSVKFNGVKFSFKYFIAFLLLVLLIGGSAYVFYFSSIFRLKKIAVIEPKSVLAADVQKEILSKYKNQLLYLVSETDIANLIKQKFPKIVNAIVEKQWPDAISVKPLDESVVLVWRSNGRYFYINEKGEPFAAGIEPAPTPAPTSLPVNTIAPTNTPDVSTEPTQDLSTPTVTQTPTNTPIPFPLANSEEITAYIAKVPFVVDDSNLPIKVGAPIVDDSFIQFINEAKSALEKKLALTTREFHIKDTTFEVWVVTDKFGIWFDTMRPADDQVATLQRVLNSKITINEYADLRIEGKVYYK